MSKYRKFLVAAIGAVITLLNAFGVPVAEDISPALIAVVDAGLVLWVAND